MAVNCNGTSPGTVVTTLRTRGLRNTWGNPIRPVIASGRPMNKRMTNVHATFGMVILTTQTSLYSSSDLGFGKTSKLSEAKVSKDKKAEDRREETPYRHSCPRVDKPAENEGKEGEHTEEFHELV